jgi:hypothetical protein
MHRVTRTWLLVVKYLEVLIWNLGREAKISRWLTQSFQADIRAVRNDQNYFPPILNARVDRRDDDKRMRFISHFSFFLWSVLLVQLLSIRLAQPLVWHARLVFEMYSGQNSTGLTDIFTEILLVILIPLQENSGIVTLNWQWLPPSKSLHHQYLSPSCCFI